MAFDIIDESVLIAAHAKEVIRFAEPFDRPPTVGTEPIHHILFGPEALIERAVPAGICGTVNQTLLEQRAEYFLYVGFMRRIRGADEGVIRDIQTSPEFLKARREPIAVRLWIYPGFLRGLLDLLSMFVEAGEK